MLSQQRFSTDFDSLLQTLIETPNLLIIQDLDGVCMPLVRDPLTRELAPHYVQAASLLKPNFFVLTNGEHIGSRGVNSLVDKAMEGRMSSDSARHYLPGLAAGGVQWQDHFGTVNHPGVSEEELAFLNEAPARMRNALSSLLQQAPYALSTAETDSLLSVVILDNPVSPTININGFHSFMQLDAAKLRSLQQSVETIMLQLMDDARQHGLGDSFFIHYAPNLGSGPDGERIKWARDEDTGTTDFQFMLRGAVKEVGVLVILNRYYHQVTGEYPLGQAFNARQAPRDLQAQLQLARDHFDPDIMPRIIGVGDTVTSQPDPYNSGEYLRGGSDRGFLTLVQELGKCFQTDNGVLFVDSSGGELNRPSIRVEALQQMPWQAVAGITDRDDPLQLNVVFPQGHRQYVDFFCQLANARQGN
ncbi:MAG: glucosylglycerol 3-phosphatase [Pseudomonadales bacterium]|nr:glucosylglycerol 3-phosphatase [Pseudomonadales bacterium]